MNQKKTLSTIALTMIVFVGVFGFANIANNFIETELRSVSLFLIGAILYFLPTVLVMAEFGSYAKDRTAGIYAWIDVGLGKSAAYYGLWCYFVSNIFYLPSLAARVPAYLMFAITGDSHLSDGMIALFGFLALLVALLIGLKFEQSFHKISTVTGYLSLFVTAVFIVAGIAVYLGMYKSPATPITLSKLSVNLTSREGIGSALSTFAWVLFAYGGAELVGPYVIRVDKPEKKFMRALMLSSLVIGALYVLGIIAMAAFGTPAQYKNVSLVNALVGSYAFMGRFFGLGLWFVKVMGLAYTIIVLVALSLWSIALTKAVFSEAPAGTFPSWLTKKTKKGVLPNALIFQTLLAALFIALMTFGGSAGSDFYHNVYNMTTMAQLLPYIFLGFSYIRFRQQGLVSPYQVSKNRHVAYLLGGVIIGFNLLAFVFAAYNIGKPLNGQLRNMFLYYGGLAFFLLLGLLIRAIPFKKDGEASL